jgi:hypothetical protein
LVRGTWTPVIGGVTSESGQTYTTQSAYYTKIGRIVHCNAYIVLATKGTITGNLKIKGLPFTSRTGANFTPVAFAHQNKWTLTAEHNLAGYVESSGTGILLYEVSHDGGNAVALTTSNITSGCVIMIQCTYAAAN